MVIAQSSLALLLVVAISSSGFSKAANLRQRNLSDTIIATNVATHTQYEQYASIMLAAVNKQRATTGLSSLCLNKKLHIAAQGHSNYMAANNIMTHVGLGKNSTFKNRVKLAGYDWTSVAENVAAGQVDVAKVMRSWIDSPEHLGNIMGDYTMFGSAFTFNGHGTYQHYWTQEFGTSDKEVCDNANRPQMACPAAGCYTVGVPGGK